MATLRVTMGRGYLCLDINNPASFQKGFERAASALAPDFYKMQENGLKLVTVL